MEKKFSPAHAGTGFGPKELKSAIKNFSPAPPQPPPKKIFYDPPLAPKSLLTYGVMLGEGWSTKCRSTPRRSDFCRSDFCRSRHLPVATFAGRDICRSRHLPTEILPVATFAGRDICRSRHLPVATFAGRDICRSRHLPVGTTTNYIELKPVRGRNI